MNKESIIKCLNMVHDTIIETAQEINYLSSYDADLLMSIRTEIEFYEVTGYENS